MRKVFLWLCCAVLFGCVTNKSEIDKNQQEKQKIIQLESELSQNKDPLETILVAEKYFDFVTDYGSCADFKCSPPWNYNHCIQLSRNASVLLSQKIKYECLYEHDQSDECILYRRELEPSKICYFNYKKYLPDNTWINTEDDFLLWVKYLGETLISSSENFKLPEYEGRGRTLVSPHKLCDFLDWDDDFDELRENTSVEKAEHMDKIKQAKEECSRYLAISDIIKKYNQCWENEAKKPSGLYIDFCYATGGSVRVAGDKNRIYYEFRCLLETEDGSGRFFEQGHYDEPIIYVRTQEKYRKDEWLDNSYFYKGQYTYRYENGYKSWQTYYQQTNTRVPKACLGEK